MSVAGIETRGNRVHYPTAEDLDSADWSETSGWSCKLYLVPAAETDDGVPRVEMHSGVGNIGWPVMAHNGRWTAIGGYGPQTVGESVLDALCEIEDRLVDLSDSYKGAEWDGHNMRGSWGEIDEPDYDDVFCNHDLRSYWTADDWFRPAAIGWEDLCIEAKIDPERALDDDWEDVAREVGETVEPLQEQQVSGCADYAVEKAREWREKRAEELSR